MLTKVIKFDFDGGHRLSVHFSTGEHGVHDFGGLIARGGSMIVPLQDEAYFRRAFLEFGALTWPNGLDISPEWLRREMEAAGELRKVAAAE
ncbi:DUF2442 domain-containing protein [Devosia sp. YIM 151766]|uniref:DUF2442 domain-containing protein n=1 Tax=Devosia sp. YIM 151766 TaxID=3017325 RepID=UPI00255C706B|nr:DUF2442 domain-containing protein [Devosia sp. YIM 151766]WIY51796.1 DUF2442 domain-containing protein [Devosia sp. YIM 151766]